jgi:protein-S-isoprenylcysteine O-methyltransferase Ste14
MFSVRCHPVVSLSRSKRSAAWYLIAAKSDAIDPTSGRYGRIRHPLMAGFVIVFWSARTMTAGHLLFAATATGYILVGIAFEEHDLIQSLGGTYTAHRARVPALIPRPPATASFAQVSAIQEHNRQQATRNPG